MRPRVLALFVLACPSPAFADDSLRCDSWLVSAGEREYAVAQKCGAPTTAASHYRPSRHARSVLVDTWTYDFGPTQFIRVLTFEDEVLVHVDVGNRGVR